MDFIRRTCTSVVIVVLLSFFCAVFADDFTLEPSNGCQSDIYLNFTENLVVSSDNFPNNYSGYTWCRYYVHGPPETRVRMNFSVFDLEESPSCAADSLKIFDMDKPGMADVLRRGGRCGGRGTGFRPPVPVPTSGPFCGGKAPPVMITKGNGVTFEFCADHEVQRGGWRVRLESVPVAEIPADQSCPKHFNLTNPGESVKIQSANYPENYGSNACEWTITTRPEYPVKIWVREFDLGGWLSSPPVQYDVLQVSDCTNNNTESFSRLKSFEAMVIKSTKKLVFTLTVNDWTDYNAKGFSIDVFYELCGDKGQVSCDNFNGCVNTSNYCDGIKHCEDGSDEKSDYCFPDCGVQNYPLYENSRIIGGVMASQYSFPWQASISIDNNHFCGASIISDQWLVSAAHCDFKLCANIANISQYKARIGGHFLNAVPSEQDSSTDVQIEKVICHPSYMVVNSKDYDYSLIKLKSKIRFRKNISPVCLPRQGDDAEPGNVCLATGWGDTVPYAKGNELRQVLLTVIDRQDCINTDAYTDVITDRMICAGTPQGGYGICQGDSGGPFVCKNNQGQWSLTGVTSWAMGCGQPGISSIFARTGSVTDWIVDILAKN